MMRHSHWLWFVVLCGCSSTQPDEVRMAPEARSMWNRCSAAVTAWCHAQGQGDPSLDRDCEANAGREFGRLSDDTARRQYLTSRRCSL